MAPEIWKLRIVGAPRTKKTHNLIVKAGTRRRVLPSKAWSRWVETANVLCFDGGHRWSLWLTIPASVLVECDVNCRAIFYRDARRGDAVGYYQGLADLLEKRGVLRNDSLIVSWDGSRLSVDKTEPRVEVTLEAA